MRIDKMLANSGIGSRREVKNILKNGLVTVDGDIVKDSATQVDTEKQIVTVEGNIIQYREFIYIMMYKPVGVLSATKDLRDTTAVELLSEDYECFEAAPAGRLDKDSEGLLFLTNDGGLIHSVISPKKHVNKLYEVWVDGVLDKKDIDAFAKGIILDDGYLTLPGNLKIVEAGEKSKAFVTIREGKFRQIRRMMASLGKEVYFLKRLAIGPLKLDEKLSPGEFRELEAAELIELMEASGYKSRTK